jgi:putative ABC transport system permease protein
VRWRDAIALARRSIIRRGGRALLTVLAVALGTALLSSLLIASDAARERVLNQVSEGGPLAGIKVEAAAPRPTALDSDDPRPGAPKLIDQDAIRQIRSLSDVASVVPIVVTPIAILPAAGTQGGSSRDGGLIFTSAVGADLTRITDLPVTLLNGRFPAPDSTTEVAVTLDYLNRIGIDKAEAQSVIGTRLTLGAPQEFRFGHQRRYRARWSHARIVGVVSQEAGDGYVVAPIAIVRGDRAWSEAGDSSNDLGISPSPYSALFVVARGLEHVTGVRTEINTVGYSTSAPETLIAQVQRYLHVVEIVLAGIGFIALAIAALGISNAMLAAIRERRREIGVLKAIGATDRDVRRVFLVEAGTLGLLGGAIGAAVGLLTAELLAGVVNRYLSSQGLQVVDLGLPLGLLTLVVVGATLLALAAGVLPAVRASRMPARQAIGGE